MHRSIVFSLFIALMAYFAYKAQQSAHPDIVTHRYGCGFLHGLMAANEALFKSVGKHIGMNYYDIYRVVLPLENMENDFYVATDTIIADVNVRSYTAKQPSPMSNAVLIYFHGGGFASGSAGVFHLVMADIIELTGINVISVDYRLVPEHQVPAGLNDCLAVTRAVLENRYPQHSYKPQHVYLAGDSAGGNMAAIISQKLKREYQIGGSVLIYPLTQTVTTALPSYRTKFHTTYHGLDPDLYPVIQNSSHTCIDDPELRSAIEKYINTDDLSELYGNKVELDLSSHVECNRDIYNKIKRRALDPELSPLFTKDLSNSPPTLVVLAGVDVLHDEVYLYYKRMQRESPDVSLAYFPQAIHGSYSILGKYFQSTEYYKTQHAIAEFLKAHHHS